MIRCIGVVIASAAWLLSGGVLTLRGQAPDATLIATPQRVFETACMTCHGNSDVERAPSPSALRLMPAEALDQSLTSGAMRVQAQGLTDAHKGARRVSGRAQYHH